MLFAVNERDPRPLYEQLVSQVKQAVAAGTLMPEEELPSVRELGDTLGINLHTVHKAYRQLHAEGIIHMRLGRRAKIAPPREKPISPRIARNALLPRINELVADAFHMRVSPDDFRAMVEQALTHKGGHT